MTEKDPIMEAKLRLESELEKLPGWELVKPVDYGHVGQSQQEADLELYKTVYDTWVRNWDATDPRYYHLVSSETFLLRRWIEFDTLPHLFLFGPPHSGKNQALEVFQRLAPKPLLVNGPSVNAVYQVAHNVHPTLFLNECDRLGKVKEASDYVQAMLQILNVYKRGEITLRGGQEGIVKVYDLFCPKILAGTEPLPGALPDRCIRIDCEKNAKDVPIDLDIPDTLKGQLFRYSGKHEEYNGLTKEQVKMMIGDNRITQLYYPLFSVCPDPIGQKAILDLAMEQLQERGNEESYSDLAQVVEAIAEQVSVVTGESVVSVVSDVGKREPIRVKLSDLVTACSSIVPKDQDGARWLGWRLKKLQFPRQKIDRERYAIISVRTLSKKIRRYAPILLTTETTATTEPDDKLTCSECGKKVDTLYGQELEDAVCASCSLKQTGEPKDYSKDPAYQTLKEGSLTGNYRGTQDT